MTLYLWRPRGVLFQSCCLFLRIAAPFLMSRVMWRKLFVWISVHEISLQFLQITFRHLPCAVRLWNIFRTYWACLYGSALWSTYTETSLRRFRSCYHKCINMFFHYERQYSVTSLLLEVSLPSFDSLLFNFRSSFNLHWKKCSNSVITRLKLLMGSGLTV